MPNWDFFIPLSQADYTLYPGIEVNNRIGAKRGVKKIMINTIKKI